MLTLTGTFRELGRTLIVLGARMSLGQKIDVLVV